MLIPLADMVQAHQMRLHGVLHVGAHAAEELPAYVAAQAGDVWWVEADPQLVPRLTRTVRRYAGQHIIEAAVTDRDGDTVVFHRANNFQSSSILPLGTHKRVSPDVHFVQDLELRTRSLRSLIDEHGVIANFWNLDIQGAELLALQGAGDRLDMAEYVYTEINVDELYVGCARLDQLDDFFMAAGFVRCDTRMAGPVGWGDALYVRRGIRP